MKKKKVDLSETLPIILLSMVQRTAKGTVLMGLTMKAFSDSLDAYLFSQRTGVNIMAENIRFPWNRIFTVAGINPDNVDKKQVLSFVEDQLEYWLKHRPSSAALTTQLEAAFAKEAPRNLHSILKSSGNKMRIDSLAAAYALKTERKLDEASLDYLRGQIRAYIYTDHAFSIGRGGMATVYRIQDEKHQDTGVEVTEAEEKVFERFTKNVKLIGFRDKLTFERAKSELKGKATETALRAWLEEQEEPEEDEEDK